MSHDDLRPIEMRVGGVVVDPTSKAPVVILRGVDDPRLFLPIFIGGSEAAAIASVLAGVSMPRPMTHDLLASVLGELSMTVHRVVVTELKEGTYYAEITLADPQGHEWTVDARPSDSIALSVRTGTRIFVSQAVLEEAGGIADEDDEIQGAVLPEGASTPPKPSVRKTTQRPEREAEALVESVPVKPPTPPVVGPDVNLEDLDPETFGKYKM